MTDDDILNGRSEQPPPAAEETKRTRRPRSPEANARAGETNRRTAMIKQAAKLAAMQGKPVELEPGLFVMPDGTVERRAIEAPVSGVLASVQPGPVVQVPRPFVPEPFAGDPRDQGGPDPELVARQQAFAAQHEPAPEFVEFTVRIKTKRLPWLQGAAAYLSYVERRPMTVEGFITRIIEHAWQNDPNKSSGPMRPGEGATGPRGQFNPVSGGWDRT